MAHEVFISHSSIDKSMADAVTAALEQAKIRCWIAPRDILPGASWGGAIVDAIETSKVMVIIFSANSNGSKQVMREVERAVQKDVVVVPFRVEEVTPSKDMEYFLSATHWLDAITPEMDSHLGNLVQTIQALLSDKPNARTPQAAASSVSPTTDVTSSSPGTSKGKNWKLIGGLAAAVVLLVSGLILFSGDSDQTDAGSSVANNSSGISDVKEDKQLVEREPNSMKLVLPKSATTAETIAVTWSGPSAKGDRVSIAKTDAQDGAYLQYANVGDTKKVDLLMPAVPGKYEVRYRSGSGRKVIERRTINVVLPDITLTLPEETKPGSEVSVQWTAPNNNGDYLATAAVGSDSGTYETYGYTRKGSPTTIKVPDVPGDYEMRYISGQGKAIWAAEKFTVPEPEVSLSLPQSVGAGESVVVDWQGPANKGDYLTVAHGDQEASEYVNYVYVKRGKKAKLKMPEESGAYEVRYISSLSKQNWASQAIEVTMPEVSVGQPENLVAGNEVNVPWQGPANQSDYLTIAEPGSEGGEYLTYKYVKAGKKIKLLLPDQAGSYVVRYIAAQTKAVWAEAAIEVVAREEELTLPNAVVAAGKKLNVKWLQKGQPRQYVAIYKVGAEVKDYESYRYTKGKTSQTLTAPSEAGTYEVRYISGQDNLVWASAKFEVQ